MGLGACSTEPRADSDLADPAELERMVNGAVVAGYGWECAGRDSVLGGQAETGVESLVDAGLRQLADAASVAAVVSRDGDDAKHIDVSIGREMTFRCVRDARCVCSTCQKIN